MKKEKQFYRNILLTILLHKKLYVGLWIFFCLLLVFLQILFTLVFQNLIDAITAMKLDDLQIQIIYTCMVISGMCVCKYLRQILYAKYQKETFQYMKAILMKAIFNKQIAIFHEVPDSTYLTYLSSCMTEIQTKFFDSLQAMLYDILLFLGAVFGIFYLNMMMGCVILLMTLMNICVPFLTRKKIMTRTEKSLHMNTIFLSYMKNIIKGADTVKFYGMEEAIHTQFSDMNKKQETCKYQLQTVLCLSDTIIFLLNYVTVCVPWFIGAYLVLHGAFHLGTLMGISQLNNNVASPLQDFFTRSSLWQSGLKVMKEVLHTIDLPMIDHTNKIDDVRSITLQSVFYSSRHHKILQDINLTFKTGKKYLLIGESGSGKSSILKMLLRYDAPDKGSIKINGEYEVSQIANVYENMHIITQDHFLFEATLLQNLTLYQTDIREDEVITIMKKVGLSHLIKRLHDQIIEDKVHFRGGEKQRIAIARALLHPSKVLLVDEACSSLDGIMGHQIESLLLTLDVAILIEVAHHVYPDLLPCYDEIIWMKKGQIYKLGSYESLYKDKEFCHFLNLTEV